MKISQIFKDEKLVNIIKVTVNIGYGLMLLSDFIYFFFLVANSGALYAIKENDKARLLQNISKNIESGQHKLMLAIFFTIIFVIVKIIINELLKSIKNESILKKHSIEAVQLSLIEQDSDIKIDKINEKEAYLSSIKLKKHWKVELNSNELIVAPIKNDEKEES